MQRMLDLHARVDKNRFGANGGCHLRRKLA